MTPEVRAQLEAGIAAKFRREPPLKNCYDEQGAEWWSRALAHVALESILSATNEHGERLVVGRDELDQVGRDADMGRLHGAPAVRVDGKWKPVFMEVGP